VKEGPWFDPTINRWVGPMIVEKTVVEKDLDIQRIEDTIEELRTEVRALATLLEQMSQG
jgi:hypothetical protein